MTHERDIEPLLDLWLADGPIRPPIASSARSSTGSAVSRNDPDGASTLEGSDANTILKIAAGSAAALLWPASTAAGVSTGFGGPLPTPSPIRRRHRRPPRPRPRHCPTSPLVTLAITSRARCPMLFLMTLPAPSQGLGKASVAGVSWPWF